MSSVRNRPAVRAWAVVCMALAAVTGVAGSVSASIVQVSVTLNDVGVSTFTAGAMNNASDPSSEHSNSASLSLDSGQTQASTYAIFGDDTLSVVQTAQAYGYDQQTAFDAASASGQLFLYFKVTAAETYQVTWTNTTDERGFVRSSNSQGKLSSTSVNYSFEHGSSNAGSGSGSAIVNLVPGVTYELQMRTYEYVIGAKNGDGAGAGSRINEFRLEPYVATAPVPTPTAAVGGMALLAALPLTKAIRRRRQA